ncbi:hypothetical protein BABINDRAFT_136466 [Babjeviella inositovora NRRL Y-12698]|uniref:Uncharacterized protein n=1 Tax=Babjeviella inositovora NRRL Y-12698 TaxID=984486 RepID=A0A1E3QS39_9ASCO|nr:uncharacterized protein BABINDRAFT_136466 [Babjeviella inositovora NRRL Y-12698]ODQ79842.1 hypothetical protein BABINDRAFT_136466 [Babjeviella inositovora NRRL Y-12698]
MSHLAPLPSSSLLAQLSRTKLVTSTASHQFRSAVVFTVQGELICAWSYEPTQTDATFPLSEQQRREAETLTPMLLAKTIKIIENSIQAIQASSSLTTSYEEDLTSGDEVVGLVRVRYGSKGECLIVPGGEFNMSVFLERR